MPERPRDDERSREPAAVEFPDGRGKTRSGVGNPLHLSRKSKRDQGLG
jgi:hypothetical protein